MDKINLDKFFWDYNVDIKPLEDFLNDNRLYDDKAERILIRIFERAYWYEIVSLLGIENLRLVLTKEFIKKIRFKDLQKRLEFARKLLHNEVVSVSGWDSESRSRLRNTILSNRWYGIKQVL
ncbi:MAG: hypothetical protein NTV87_15875 [Ignavibacteriae bacterium]|nr:hypothetical protein [Ignavibacteriota bacterium]